MVQIKENKLNKLATTSHSELPWLCVLQQANSNFYDVFLQNKTARKPSPTLRT